MSTVPAVGENAKLQSEPPQKGEGSKNSRNRVSSPWLDPMSVAAQPGPFLLPLTPRTSTCTLAIAKPFKKAARLNSAGWPAHPPPSLEIEHSPLPRQAYGGDGRVTTKEPHREGLAPTFFAVFVEDVDLLNAIKLDTVYELAIKLFEGSA